MEVEMADSLRVALEHEFMKKIRIFEELTDLKVSDISITRVYSLGGGSEPMELKITVEL